MEYQSTNSRRLKTVICNEFSELSEYQQEWNGLLADSYFPNVFLTWEWISVWWKHFGAKRQLCAILLFDSADKLIASFPMWVGTVSLFDKVEIPFIGPIDDQGIAIPGIREIGFALLGDGSQVCPEYLGPIIHKEYGEEVITVLVDQLSAIRGMWQMLRLSNMLEASSETQNLLRELKSGYRVEVHAGEICYFHELPKSYETFLSELSTKRIKTIKGTLKKAEKAFKVRLETVDKINDVDRGFDLIQKIYTKSRRGSQHIGGWARADYMDFHRDVAKAFASKKWLQLYILWFDEIAVAFVYCYFYKDIMYFYQTSYDNRYKDYSPGAILLQFSIREAISKGAKQFDHLRGDERYKLHFAKNFRKQIDIMVFKKKRTAFLGYKCRRRLSSIYQKVCRNA